MRLNELEPFWLSLGGNLRKTGFAFRCPHCRVVWLTCKAIPATMREQVEVMRARGIDEADFVPTGRAAIWHWEGEFLDLHVSPSIDASSSGHWVGRIRDGEIE